MKALRFFGVCWLQSLERLCRRRWLLAGLVLLCFLLPLAAGQAAGRLLMRGVDFSGVTLAVSAPEGDRTPQLLEQYMGDMEDIAQYCTIRSMGQEQALAALETGEITAVLVLPEHFIQGVMQGENPDLRLIVAGDRPLESLLLLWVGQSASDILSAFQSGVYAVLEYYDQAPPPGLTRDQVVADINLRYIRLALDRESLFQTRMVSATGVLPVSLHYSLAAAAFLGLCAAPLLLPVYGGSWLAFQRRLRSVGRGIGAGWFSAVTAGAAVLFGMLAPALLLAGEGSAPARLGTAAGMALYCSVFGALCCLAAGSAAGCGTAAFVVALLSLVLAGGLVPPVLLPAGLRRLSGLSPVSWLMGLAAWPMGYAPAPSALVGLALSGAGMLALSLALYRRRVEKREAEG